MRRSLAASAGRHTTIRGWRGAMERDEVAGAHKPSVLEHSLVIVTLASLHVKRDSASWRADARCVAAFMW
jgi:hypothetical protein